MADDRHQVAVDTVAHGVLVAVCDRDALLQSHGAFPELDLTVFTAVVDRVVQLANTETVSLDEYSAAVDYLSTTQEDPS